MAAAWGLRPLLTRTLVNKPLYRYHAAIMAGVAKPAEAAMERTANDIPGLRRTVWDQQNQLPQYPKITSDESADVVVVGAGIAGISVAYNLVKEGKKVILLEAKTRGSGQTGRTTAHIMPWNDDFYHLIEKQHGWSKATLVAESHRAAIKWVKSIVEEEKLDCQFECLDGYLFPYTDSEKELQRLNTEYEACKRIGLDVEMIDLGGDPSVGKIKTAIRFPDAAEFHPLMYINGLAEAFHKRGGKLYEMSTAFQIDSKSVKTTDGIVVKADNVVVTTNSPLNHDLFVHARQQPHRTYVAGFKVPKGSVRRAQYWDTYEPYRYIRLEPKDDYDVLIVGGADTSAGMKPEEYGDPYGFLAAWARERWTMVGELLYTWTGQVYEPSDSLHLIGLDPLDSYYIFTGDSGQGMTGGTIAGILITDLIMGRPNPWDTVYSPSRGLPVEKSAIQNMIEEAEHTFQGYKDKLPFFGSDGVDIEDLLPNSGAVIQKGLHKVAVYKDPNGNVHKYSAVCPHMKCIIKWNPLDATFDCPCHGSIFDCYGRVVNGPAKANLFPA